MDNHTSIENRHDVKISDQLINHKKLVEKLPHSNYRILAGYGSALYPVTSVMGVGMKGGTAASRAAEILKSQTKPVLPQIDFILANGDKAMKKTSPFSTSVEYTPNINIDDDIDCKDENKNRRVKIATTTLRSLSDDLRNWNMSAGLHWRLSKPSLILASSEAYNASSTDENGWLNKFLIDVDANRYYTLLLTLMQLNEGHNFVYQQLKLSPTLNVSKLLHRIACTSYDGDVRTADALSIESVPAAKWAKALQVHTVPWLATYLPILNRYKNHLSIEVEGIDQERIDAIVKAAAILEDRRLERLEGMMLRNQSDEMPSDENLLYDMKDIFSSANDILECATVKKDMNVWMVDERKGMDQPLGFMYESLPKGVQLNTNRISARSRLWRLYGPHTLGKEYFQALGGPLPTEPYILRKGVRAMNCRDSFKLACNGLYKNGIAYSLRYVKEKALRHRLH